MAYRDEVYFQAPTEPEAPFDEEEFAGRLQRIRAAMARAGIDCLFVHPAPDAGGRAGGD